MSLHTLAFIQANQYKDSVALMRVAQHLLALPEVVNASLQLGNPANKEILREAGLLTPEVQGAGPSDIMVVVQAQTRAACDAAAVAARSHLAGEAAAAGGAAGDSAAWHTVAPRTLAMGRAALHGANLAQISVPGAYAAAEALKAVHLGLHVFLFSDNVPLAQEVALKQAARERGVLVMGPDCGTALIGGVPLGFANQVRRGPIGIVAASGTGLQEVSTQVHRMGSGISHAIGTGGRDTQAAVGAITLLQGIALLAADAATRVIAVISKPPAPEVAARVMQALHAAGKPAVVLFIGEDATAPAPGAHGAAAASAQGPQGRAGPSAGAARGATPVRRVATLVDCAAEAVRLAGRRPQADGARYLLPRRPAFVATQKYLRALYSGGTFAAEAQALWARAGVAAWSNVPIDKTRELPEAKRASREHTVLDLGDDAFTVGRPHPMIDQTTRIERLLQEAADPAVRVVVLDVVIGWGAHADPATELAAPIREARRVAAAGGRPLAVVGFVCGTELDPQRLSTQEATLRAAGMVLAGNSANAAWLAASWAR